MTIQQPVGDLYAELGVDDRASREQIVAAFRARAKSLHPDMNPGDAEAAEQFKTLGRAYQVLADPDARARYDAGADGRRRGAPGVRRGWRRSRWSPGSSSPARRPAGSWSAAS